MTKKRKAILWGPDDLLAKAMKIFLKASDKQTWQVIRLPKNQCLTAFVEKMQEIQPDLLILYQSRTCNGSDPLTKLFEEFPELKRIADQPQLRVITLSLENNMMQVYSKQSVTVRQASDLLSVAEDRYFLENPATKEDNRRKTKVARSRRLPATLAGKKSSRT